LISIANLHPSDSGFVDMNTAAWSGDDQSQNGILTRLSSRRMRMVPTLFPFESRRSLGVLRLFGQFPHCGSVKPRVFKYVLAEVSAFSQFAFTSR